MGIHCTGDADRGTFRRGVTPHTPDAARQKAARRRHVCSKSVRRQVLKGEWM